MTSAPRGQGLTAPTGRLEALLQRRWLIVAVLTTTLAGAFSSWYLADSRATHDARSRFERDAEHARLVIRERLNLYEYALHGARSLYAASHSVERDEWQAFVSGLSLGERYPGMKGLAYVVAVPEAHLAEYEKAARADGAPDFKAQATPGHEQGYIVHFVEPSGQDRDLLGLDLAADPTLRTTLEESRDEGRPQLSGQLAALPQLAASGDVLFCLPIYRTGEAHWTLAERRASLEGWAAAPIRVSELVRAIGEEIPAGLDLKIYDGDGRSESALIYEGHPHDAAGGGRSGALHQQTTVDVASHRWTLILTERDGFAAVDRSRPLLVLLVGLLGSGLLTGLIWTLGAARSRAVALAESMTGSLREREAEARKLAMVASRTDNGALVMDARGQIEWVNLGFTRITDYALDEVAGHDPATLLLGEQTDPATIAEIRACMKHGREFKGELVGRGKSGKPLWLAVEIQPAFDPDGALTNFVAIQTDISERKRFERELLEAKETAIAASRAKSEFLANMSHEIRTPMNGVIGMTELLLDTELAPEQRQFAECTRSSAEGLLGIINDILDFSKIEAGKLDLEQIPFSLRNTLGNTLKPLGMRADQKNLELLLDVGPDVPDAVIGDPSRLRQIVVNLVGNAIKFTEKGEIVVRVRTDGDGPEGASLHFEVADTGIGIPAEKQARVFEAFAQADGTITRRYGGTGLGLAISQQLVRLMGGTLWLESEPGRGSIFHFTTHFALQDEIALEPAPVAVEALRDMPVLVVDDNQTNRAILIQMFRNWGMQPTAVAGGVAALGALKAAAVAGRPIPLVLLDVQMPEMDGFTVAELIRQEPVLDGTLIVLLTSSGQMGDGARCRQLQVSGYLTKPVTGADLAEVVRTVLGGTSAEPRLVTRHTLREGQARYHVLLAEDNEVNRMLAAKLLTKRGHTFVAVNDGRQAMAALDAGGRFDLVLMDVQMPVMDGFEATAAIREREAKQGGHLPIVALTAHAIKGDLERCLAAGMDAYVSKPIRATEFYELINRLVSASRERESEDGEEPEAKAA
jgi:PAS domain S-box-containing protein